MIIVASLLMIGAIYFLAHHIPKNLKELSLIKKRILSYEEYVPMILRIGLGILLIGASLHNVFLMPSNPFFPSAVGVEIIVGVCLLLGLMITPSLLIIIGFYIAGIIHNGYLIGNLEILGSSLAILLLANSRPGFDNILNIPELFRNKWAKYAPLILRVALGGGFIFLSFYEKIFNPHYFANLVENNNLMAIIPVTPAMWALLFGILQMIIGFFVLFGFKTRITSILVLFFVSFTYKIFGIDFYAVAVIFSVVTALFITGGGKISIDDHIEHPPKKVRKSADKKPRARKARKSTAKKTTRKRAVKKLATN